MGDRAVPKLIDWIGALAYLEWGSRLAVINSEPGVNVEEDQPMPKWGWGEVGGPYIVD